MIFQFTLIKYRLKNPLKECLILVGCIREIFWEGNLAFMSTDHLNRFALKFVEDSSAPVMPYLILSLTKCIFLWSRQLTLKLNFKHLSNIYSKNHLPQ